MNNFIYQNPVKIVFGKDQINSLGSLLPKNGKIMVTYGGGSIKQNGIYDSIVKALDGFSYIEFGGIEPNPKYETLMKAVQIGKQENVDFLLAIGGGSVLDGTKFIAAALPIDNDPWDILLGKTTVNTAIPIGTVLTLPATGSEMNGGAVISRISTKEKYAFISPLVMPQFSILDPQVCSSLPHKQIANGIVDTYVHVVEQYITYPVNAMVQDYFAESILKTLIEVAPKVLSENPAYDDFANFMWSATIALNGIIGSGVPQDWATHDIGHELTALHGIDHARTLAIVLPGLLSVMRSTKREKLEQYAYRIWGISAGTSDERIDEAIAKTIAFFESTGIKTRLNDYGVNGTTISVIASRFKSRGTILGENQDINYETVEKILNIRL
ncbi:MAG: iron-containing alcohol dehydrogenase [Paludibacter sp.]|nr:iron-containing alcohol dehydrogenase [Paludibacter sp.]